MEYSFSFGKLSLEMSVIEEALEWERGVKEVNKEIKRGRRHLQPAFS